MRTLTVMLWLAAVVPGVVAGSVVAIVGLGFLSGEGLIAAFAATAVVSVVLAVGGFEAPVSRALGFARGLRAGEQWLLEPAMRLTGKVDLAPGRVLVRLVDGDGAPVTPIGRRTVVIAPWLVAGPQGSRLSAADVATVIGHAVAGQRVGPARFDLAVRLWMLPWTLVMVAVRQVARRFAWVPAGGLAWRLRGVLGAVALYQGFLPDGQPRLGIVTAVVVALSYIAPAADRAWRALVEREADRIVAARGLGEQLAHFVQWQDGPGCMERLHRIRVAAEEPIGGRAAAVPTSGASRAGPPAAELERSRVLPGPVPEG